MKQLIQRTLAAGVALTLLGSTVPTFAAGVPETQTVGVQLNGQTLFFSDAVPQVKDERTFLPFRAVFEALGADVSYEENVISAVRGSRNVSMTLGSPDVQITEDGKTWTVTMDVAPYVDESTWRTYVPVRFAAETLDCSVGWDQDAYTAVILDRDTLLADAMEGKQFTYLEKLAQYSRKYNVGQWDVNMTMDGEISMMGIPLTIAGSAEGGVSDNEKVDMAVKTTMDMRPFLDNLSRSLSGMADAFSDNQEIVASSIGIIGGADGPTEIFLTSPEEEKQLEALAEEGILTTVRGDLSQGVFYVNMQGTFLTAESGIEPDVWYRMDLNDILSMSGMDMDLDELTAVSETTDPGTLLSILPAMSSVDDVDAYPMLKELISALSDDAFVQTDPGNPSEYVAAVEANGTSMTIVLDMEDGVVRGYSMAVAATVDSEDGMPAVSEAMTVSVDSEDNMTAEVFMELGGLMTMQLTMEGTYVQGSRTLETAPPANAKVVDIMEIWEGEVSSDA